MTTRTGGDEAPTESRAILIALIVAIAAFMQSLDSNIISTAIPGMAASFGTTAVDVGAGIVVYVLAASIVIPACAWLSDRVGAKRLFIWSIAGFAVASVLCGTSTTLPAFIAARTAQGITGALMSAVGQLILVRSVDRGSLLKVMNISSAPMLVAPALGPPLGGLITDTLGWSWIFYLNVPVGVAGVLAAMRFLNPLPTTSRPFDGTGFAMNAAALSAILLGLERMSRGGSDQGIGAAVGGAGLVLGYLAIRHMRGHAHPILSLAPFRHQTYAVATGISMPFVRLPIGTLLFAVPILLQVCLGYSAFWSGMALFAHAAGDLLMKLFMTATFRRFGYRTTLLVSLTLMSTGIAATVVIGQTTPFALIMALLFASGCARSFVMTGLNTLAFAEVTPDEAPSAVTMNQVVLQVVAALSVSLAVLLIETSGYLRAGAGAQITTADVHLALLALGLSGYVALPWLWRLPANAGHQLTGRG